MSTGVIINPGSGPVQDASLENAKANIKAFVSDLGVAARVLRLPKQDDDGRFGFRVRYNDKRVDVDMPGIPLDQVRYVNKETQNIWHFPRLYVDGSSWVWIFAVHVAQGGLDLPRPETGTWATAADPLTQEVRP